MSLSYNLLLVEDSADDAELLLHSLRAAPFKFTAVRVETEAEYDAALTKELPDVVLCDFNLPRFSTERALKILNDRRLDIPFIVVSHHIGEEAAVAAMQNGASDYLLKNRLGRLSSAIEAAIGRRVSRQQQALAEEALRASESMKRGILNSLNTRIAVLDGNGIIVATNKAWDSYGDTRSQSYKAPAALGNNYFDLLQEAVDRGDDSSEQSMKSLRSVIDRETTFASVEYERTVPGGIRWFVARAMPLEGSTDGAVISHEDITDRMLAHRALADVNRRLQAMSKRVLTIQEEERRGISRELHDDIGQSMAALKIGLHRLAQRIGDEHREILDQCLSTADSTLEKLRDLSLQLRPPQLDQLGLDDALHWLVDQQRNNTGLDISCNFVGLTERLPPVLEGVCYRIAQEALNNATRHAKAKKIGIRVELSDRLLKLAIHDDGVGFDIDAARNKAIKTGSLGLISMEERAQLAGGRLKVRTVQGGGTTVQASFALTGNEKSAAHESVDHARVGST
ncbi:MAG: histidine kinase [Betaproteobacteria bacterium]